MRTTYQDNAAFKIIIELRDAEDNLFDPDTGPSVAIFAPSGDTDDDSSAVVLNATTASLGDPGQTGTNLVIRESLGLYSYTYPITADAELGSWVDRWTFTNDSVSTEADFSFTVLERLRIESVQLTNNMCVQVVLDDSITDEDGTELGTDITLTWWTIVTGKQ